ncbi:MAG TPA: hypothetical protein VHB77_12060 [Planctomycetaceae bacterium]|nr:hypothetical protein [Planctomycetaceae bacterium]
MPTRPFDSRTSVAPPLELCGKWVAWSSDHSRIVAHANSMQELWQIVRAQGVVDPVFEKVPRAGVRWLGAR